MEVNFIEWQIQNWVEKRRPSVEMRDLIDLVYTFEKNTLILYHSRKPMYESMGRIKAPIAKLRYIKSTNTWKIYWMRGNLKWHIYEPSRPQSSIEEALKIIEEDRHGCFFG